jgi:hypothetical protein
MRKEGGREKKEKEAFAFAVRADKKCHHPL